MDNPKRCKQCNEEIVLKNPKRIAKLSKRVFCSAKCYHENYKGRKINRVVGKISFEKKKCLVCGSVFETSINDKRDKSKRLCSKRCQIIVATKRIVKAAKDARLYTPEELKKKKLEWGRKSYKKHAETRLFYYRQLAAIRRGIKGKFSKEEWNRVLREQKNKCKICKIQMEKPTIDHIIPISKWELWKQINPVNYECNDIQNIQILCLTCNIKKKDKL